MAEWQSGRKVWKMIQFSKQDKEFIMENFENAKDIFTEQDIKKVLRVIDDLIMYKGFDENYNLNDLGRKAQRVYDSIYYNNANPADGL
ncbi:hypothetical protein [Christensenella intestinihominis]|uniref:hypothetical protein n=1 Tax=Christensenella intestinihominis TaxID=1851429 RepID=UPI00155FB0F0|nr:hypothetical protein [Christensenella intestinihominis]